MPNKERPAQNPTGKPEDLGRVTKATGKLVGVWFHPEIVRLIDQEADTSDLDRSQWIRRACENQLAQ
jgi:hypothetical protein